ncbi:MAG: putative metal-binding motif-containing protein, partial [Myxococcota bacterium]|nr:putative metal-binding motif-containing protein [Myxococcota bacterium]
MRWLFACVCWVWACNSDEKLVLEVDEGVSLMDNDGDGYTLADDCDENNSAVNISAEELCDGIDNNCDGVVDEGVLTVYYLDYDEDGFGDDDRTLEACTLPVGYVPNGNDCDDSNETVFPGNTEICDGLDNDCNGQTDEGTGGMVYADVDADGFGDINAPMDGCDNTDGYVQNALDCDDNDPTISPNATETCDDIDNNCDGEIDEGLKNLYFIDSDGDGFGDPLLQAEACFPISGYVTDNSDCNDSEITVNPNQFEICDLMDNNCDGTIDEGVTNVYYADLDQDGFGDPNVSTNACTPPFAYTDNSDDCNDSDSTLNPADADEDGFSTCDNDCNDAEATVNPNQFETCDGVDNDCDGDVDELVQRTFYADLDQDGYGDPNVSQEGCALPFAYIDNADDCDDSNSSLNPADLDGDGFSTCDNDCNDSDSSISPNQFEVCDGLDNNCDGNTDEAVTNTYYADFDSDGFGNPQETTEACSPPMGYTTDSTDCNDSNSSLNPADVDGDGFSTCDNDCDDTTAAMNPNQFETCDGLDNNCDGAVDEGVTTTYYADLDQDGYGDPNISADACAAPFAHIDNDSDCDDSSIVINPDGLEICNGLDDDCDGAADAEFMTGSVYTDLHNCGFCGNDCTNQGYLNATSNCDTTLPTPACNFACDAGYFDANSDSSDGCECLFLSSDDAPFDGLDANCDGGDGDHNDAIHVSVGGSLNGSGTVNDPITGIQAAIQLAVNTSKTYVLVESGTYNENIILADGLVLLGSMDSSFDSRSLSTNPSIIMGDGTTPTMQGFDISTATEVDGFQIWSPTVGSNGSSAIAVYLEDCSDGLVFTENTIGADDAEVGIDGDGGANGSNGGDGGNGLDSALTSCSSTRFGGAAGGNACSTNSNGGNGAEGACPFAQYNGNPISSNTQPYGSNGSGTSPGLGGVGACDSAMFSWYGCGSCFLDTSCDGSGDAGTNGGDGAQGGGGSGASSSGYLLGSTWITTNGVDGLDGTDGSGGGGGGAGSGGYSSGCGTNHGSGTGGGGGAGGCLGTGGQAGTGGGSSFGVIYKCTATCSTLPIFIDNEITAGDGGNGGDGGDGGLGGLGGQGGFGGSVTSSAWCSGDGGAGGDGGVG